MADTSPPTPRVGDPAPDFTLPSTAGENVTLSSLRGKSKVVLAFFPLAFTGVCTAELCDFTDHFSQFAGMEARVLGISVDSIPTLKEFKAKHAIAVDLLSDFKREVCRRYGTLLEDRFFSRRAYFLIDREGVLRWTFTEGELGQRRQSGEILTQISALG